MLIRLRRGKRHNFIKFGKCSGDLPVYLLYTTIDSKLLRYVYWSKPGAYKNRVSKNGAR